jgi:signal peptidase
MNKKLFLKILIIIISFIAIIASRLLISTYSQNYALIIRPCFWISLAIAIDLIMPKIPIKYNSNSKDIRQLALIASLLVIILYFSLGLIIGYSKSPYSHTIFGILKNIWMIVIVVISKEFVRHSFIKRTKVADKWFIIIFTTLFFTALDINIEELINVLVSVSSTINFILVRLILNLTINSFLSYLIYRDGYKSSLLFIIPFTLISILTPVFPTNSVTISLIVKSFVCLIIYLMIERTYFYNKLYTEPIKEGKVKNICKAAFSILLFILLIFSTGVLPYKPIVIVSNSMYPTIKVGDVVIVKKEKIEKIKVDDIVEYKMNGVSIIHRAIEINDSFYNGRFLIAKGDNNKSIDPKIVTENQINGKIVSVLPYVGFPSVWFRKIIGIKNKEIGVELGEI